MNQPNNVNHITEGPILKSTIRLALPIFIGHFLSLIYVIVDTLFIMKIDPSSTAIISGVGLVSPLFLLIMAVGTGLSIGLASLTARLVGEKNMQDLKMIADTGFFLSLALCLLFFALFSIFGKSLISLLAGNKLSILAVNSAVDYLGFLIPGFCFLLILFTFAGILQGEGQVHFFALAMTISTVLNIILDPLFIFGLDMGVKGAALATTLSIGSAMVFMGIIVALKANHVKLDLNIFKISKSLLQEIIRVGFPQVLSMIALSLGVMFLNNLVSSISETSMSSWILVCRMDEILLIIGYALSGATLTQIGQNFGEKKGKRMLKIFKSNILAGFAAGLVLVVIYNIAAYRLFSLFSNVEKVIEASVFQVRILSLTFVGIIISIIANAAFQGAGKAMPGFIITVLRLGIFIIPLSYFCVNYLQMGIMGIFIPMAAGNILGLILSYFWTSHHLKKVSYSTA